MVEKFPMEEEEIFFFILNLKMWGFLNYMEFDLEVCGLRYK